MAIDWKKNLNLFKRTYFWYMKVGLIAIPFGMIYGFVVLYLGHENMPVLMVVLLAAIAAVYKIQGMPPSK